MAAYVIADIAVTDPAGYEEYRKLAGASLAAFGGKFVVRGGSTAVLEGNWQPERLVVLEFPSVEDAKAWWRSDSYRVARDVRSRAAITHMIVAEGVA